MVTNWTVQLEKHQTFEILLMVDFLDLLPPKPKFTFRHLKKGIQEFHRKFVSAPADKAANNVVVV